MKDLEAINREREDRANLSQYKELIETIEDNLKLLPKFKSLTDINKNEIELFLSSDNQGQLLKIRIFVFNLYTKINKEEKIWI